MVGEWPQDGSEFTLVGPLPAHEEPADVPENIASRATARGRRVCYYNPNSCQTCFCDGEGNMECGNFC